MNLHESSAQQVIVPQQLEAYLDFTMRRLCSNLQYRGLVKYVTAIETLLLLQEINLA
jgi:hypothetical protein